MNTSHTTATMANPSPWTLADRTHGMNPSVLRELLKVVDKPHMISFAGGLPSPKTFPVDAFARACERLLTSPDATASLQYSASEGYLPLREWVAQSLPWEVSADQVLITTGSQQGLDLVAKVLIDAGSPVLVESPTYLGALQAFAPMQPTIHTVASDAQGIVPSDLPRVVSECSLAAQASSAQHTANTAKPRFLYLLPNFQNPTGRTLSETRRTELAQQLAQLGIPLVEDNPYGDLWFDAPPPLPLSARLPHQSIYLGSFSKILAPGLRLGFMVAPPALYPKLLQAKQAADLHSASFNQRLAHEVIATGLLDTHIPMIRTLYKSQRDCMVEALARHMPHGVTWNTPEGGMFLWLTLPDSLDATKLLQHALTHNVAFVPGQPFDPAGGHANNLRLSFVTATEAQIAQGIATLGDVVKAALARG